MVDYSLVAGVFGLRMKDRARFLGSMSAQDRLIFYSEVVYRLPLSTISTKTCALKTYQIGDALLGVPRRIRDGLRSSKEYREGNGLVRARSDALRAAGRGVQLLRLNRPFANKDTGQMPYEHV